MKGNVTMVSKDRVLFGVTIRQDTKNGFLSVTDLQEAYLRARIENGWASKNINEILSGDRNTDRVYFILKETNIINIDYSIFIEEVKQSSLVKVLKKYNAYITAGARENKRVMCNPYIFALIAMEMNPLLYAKVIIWLTDNLITNRIEAGDKYNELCRAASKFKDVDYAKIGRALNYVIFNQHEKMLRNTATQEELKEIDETQKSLAFAINMGYIKTFDSLMGEMRKLWHQKWGNK